MSTAQAVTDARVRVLRGQSASSSATQAVAEVLAQIQQDDQKVVLFFASTRYDLDELAAALRDGCSAQVVLGCTSAGEHGPAGPTRGGLSAVGFAGEVDIDSHLIRLGEIEEGVAAVAAGSADLRARYPERSAFGLLLADGLSKQEERLALALYRDAPMIPIVGGSAGDDLTFQQTLVFHDGAFHRNAAVFATFALNESISTIKFQHFEPGEELFVITDADPNDRIIREINGEPASVVYARAIGVAPEKLDSATCSHHPIVVQIGDQVYVRSIASVNADGSLGMFCAVDVGVVFTLGVAIDPVETTRRAFSQAVDEIGAPQVVLGCTCILRRLEFEQSGRVPEICALYRKYAVSGFDTYGEQFNGVHVNQTFTGVAIGAGSKNP